MEHKNPTTKALISALKKEKKPLWQSLAKELSRPQRNIPSVNVGKIARLAQEGMTLVVPGKVLGNGVLDAAVNVAALSFSDSARKKIGMAKGKALTIQELMKSSPKKVRIIK